MTERKESGHQVEQPSPNRSCCVMDSGCNNKLCKFQQLTFAASCSYVVLRFLQVDEAY
jgi:hypothetical protein